MATSYTALEQSSLSSLGVAAPTFNGTDVSFYATTSFIYTLFFIGIVMAAFYGYALAGIWRMQASQESITKSNEKFKKVTLGLLGVFSLFLIIFTVNQDLLTGDVGLADLKATRGVGGGGVVPITNTGGSGGSSATCESKESVVSKAGSTGGVCGGVSCKVLSGCNYQQYRSIIESESSAAGINPKMIIVTMCKESSAKPAAQNQNPNGTFDCGLMQINQSGPCTASILDPTENIRRGVAEMKKKINFAPIVP